MQIKKKRKKLYIYLLMSLDTVQRLYPKYDWKTKKIYMIAFKNK